MREKHPDPRASAATPRPAARAAPPPLEQEAFLAVVRAADLLLAELQEVLKPFELSSPLYNVLRILRGAGEPGLPSSEIAARMINRDPDITRLVDRLERRSLVARRRPAEDRRVILVTITRAGRGLLSELDGPVADLHCRQLSRLGKRRLRQLVALLEAAHAR